MRYRLFMMSLISIFIAIAYFLYTLYPQLGVISKIELVYGVLLIHLGTIIGIALTALFSQRNLTNIKIYKRELEKESVASDEATAQIKVLKSKIEVLEKALQQALKK